MGIFACQFLALEVVGLAINWVPYCSLTAQHVYLLLCNLQYFFKLIHDTSSYDRLSVINLRLFAVGKNISHHSLLRKWEIK